MVLTRNRKAERSLPIEASPLSHDHLALKGMELGKKKC